MNADASFVDTGIIRDDAALRLKRYLLDEQEFNLLLSFDDVSRRPQLLAALLKAEQSMRQVLLFKESQVNRGLSYRDEWQVCLAHCNSMAERRTQLVTQRNSGWNRLTKLLLSFRSEELGFQLGGALEEQMRAWDVLVTRFDRAPTLPELKGQDQAFRAVEAQVLTNLRATISVGWERFPIIPVKVLQLMASINNHQLARTRAIEAFEANDVAMRLERLIDSVTGAFLLDEILDRRM